MPVLLWSERDGVRATEVRSGRPVRLSAEEYRAEAELLDPRLDELLDNAFQFLDSHKVRNKPPDLLKAWLMGRAVSRSEVLQDSALRDEIGELLWQALAHKCWYGLRADGSQSSCWRCLRPVSDRLANPLLSKGMRRIYEDFEIGLWLQAQEYEEADTLFFSKLRNAKELFRRPAQRHVSVRNAILVWVEKQPEELQMRLTFTKEFCGIPKALSKTFPSRGPGSARLPQYIDQQKLQQIVSDALDTQFCESGT